MGVRGLTTFIAQRSGQYLEKFELHDCYLVIDGNSIACQLYKWHCKSNDCFGGDYDNYAHVVHDFFQLLIDCHVVPLVMFDGGYEDKKLKTVFSRMKNKIRTAHGLNAVTEGSVCVFPLCMRDVFLDIVVKLGVKCVRCDFEGDGEAALLARSLNCPVVSYDSDFYIFDCLYIPFSTMDLRLKKKKKVNYVSCEIYKIEKFLDSFGGLDKVNLPLLAALLGNDYIKKGNFAPFYRHLKLQKGKNQNEQQRLIKTLIMWLRNETPDSALRKILGRYKIRNRRGMADKIETAITSYQCVDSKILSNFNLELNYLPNKIIGFPNFEEISQEPEPIEECLSQTEIEESSEEDDGPSCEINQPDNEALNIPIKFLEKFRNCLYPPSFMDIILRNTYYCIPQVEDSSLAHSHTISLEIVMAIHKILKSNSEEFLTCVARNEHLNVTRFQMPLYEKAVPEFLEIENMGLAERKQVLLDILNLNDDHNLFNLIPSSWHLFLVSMKYWVSNSKSKINLSYIYSVILCAIVISFVDTKLGFYRSTKSLLNRSSSNTESKSDFVPEIKISAAIDRVDIENCVSCMKKVLPCFQMNVKMEVNHRLYDKVIVHEFSNFQSCLLHVRYLNSLLNCPYPSYILSDFYDGTFLYNMTVNLLKRADLKSYMKIFLNDCPIVLNIFELMIDNVVCKAIIDFRETNNKNAGLKKTRKRKNRNKKPHEIESCVAEDNISNNEEEMFDSNNFFSLLSSL